MQKLRVLLFLCAFAAAACGEVDETPDARPSDPAEAFCADYALNCGFGNSFGGEPYTDRNDCVDEFNRYNDVQRDCVVEHMAFAIDGDAAGSCPAAAGGTPCDPDSTFCAQYDLTCGFANNLGGDPFTDASDCQTRYDQFDAARKMCVQQHLGFASSDPGTHCPHVAGAPPCD